MRDRPPIWRHTHSSHIRAFGNTDYYCNRCRRTHRPSEHAHVNNLVVPGPTSSGTATGQQTTRPPSSAQSDEPSVNGQTLSQLTDEIQRREIETIHDHPRTIPELPSPSGGVQESGVNPSPPSTQQDTGAATSGASIRSYGPRNENIMDTTDSLTRGTSEEPNIPAEQSPTQGRSRRNRNGSGQLDFEM